MPLGEIVPVLQIAIGPVILISGVGLLLLAMTNRFGRVVDWSRQLKEEQRSSTGHRRTVITAQLDVLARRGRVLRTAIGLATTSALLAAVLVIVLFATALLRWQDAWPTAMLFTLCMIALIGSLLAFLREINLSLEALGLELSAGADEV